LGVLRLPYDEFYYMTPFEYHNICQGFAEHQTKINIQNAWLTGLMVGKAFGASKENPYPSLDEITAQLTTPPDTEEELFELAKEKGVEVPEGK
jgi:hypothetical protein